MMVYNVVPFHRGFNVAYKKAVQRRNEGEVDHESPAQYNSPSPYILALC